MFYTLNSLVPNKTMTKVDEYISVKTCKKLRSDLEY